MKCISVRQPYAYLLANGDKQIETRGRRTHYRGEILIHASKLGSEGRAYTFDRNFYEKLEKDIYPRALPKEPEAHFHFGAIIGVAELYDCLSAAEIVDELHRHRSRFHSAELILGWLTDAHGYPENRFGWLMRNARLLAQPLIHPGRLGVFDVPDKILKGKLA